ncbi:MAG: TolC family protein [Deltaproteobacteria bacterium]|nr:TolC family protein [Deltaproteobacteria bacterium]
MNGKIAPLACVPGAVAIMLALTALPASGRAEPPKGSAVTQPTNNNDTTEIRVTWQDIVKLVAGHPRIAVGNQKTAAARAAVDAAGAVPNPRLEANTAYGQARDSSASRIEWGLGLSIPLGWIAQRGAKIEAADAEAKVADAESKALRRDVLLQLRVLFWNLVHNQERVTALAELSSQTATLAKTVKRRVERGESRPVEATRVEIEAEKVAGELALARSTMKTRRIQLGLWLGVRKGQKLTAVADLAKLPQPISATRARSQTLSSHPAVVAAQARVQALTAAVSIERRARIPGVSIKAFTNHELDRTAYGVGLAVDLPFWNWNSGNIRRAGASLAAGRSQLEVDRIEIESIVVEAQAACQAGVRLAIRYRDKIQPRSTSAAQTIERTYELGEATLLEVIDARRTLLETRTQFLATLAQAQNDCSRLAVLVGEDLP